MALVAPPRSASIPKLPTIQHPLAKLSPATEHLDLHGNGTTSRPGTRLTDSREMEGMGRPLASEFDPQLARSRRQSRVNSRLSVRTISRSMPNKMYEIIPEGVETTPGDPNKARLPVFGLRKEAADAVLERVRNGIESRESNLSRASSRLSEITKTRIALDQIETIIKEKMRGAYYEMRKRFIDNDPEQKGNVTRDALLRILVSTTGQPISQSNLSVLFERWSLRKDKQMISFTEFFAALRDTSSSEYPSWMDTVQRQQHDTMPAEKVHELLKERMRQRFINMADVFPQFIDGGTGRMLKHELRNALNKMLLFMDDAEFEKLWKQYDPHNIGTVNGVTMLKKMGIIMQNVDNKKSKKKELNVKENEIKNLTPVRRFEEKRQRSLQVESWLKDRLREGFKTLKTQLEAKDPENLGLVSPDDFLAVLNNHNLKLEKRHLHEFLARCAVPDLRDGVPYRDFLHRFQDRSEAGMTHKIMSNPHHRNEDDETSKNLSVIEFQLMQMFHRDFLALLGSFKKLDRLGLGLISQEEFRALMESRFSLELTDSQFENFVQKLPLNKDGLVKYEQFLKQFDTSGLTPSLFSDNKKKATSLEPEPEFQEDVSEIEYDINQRTVGETVTEIKKMFSTRFQQVERAFYDLDKYNSGRLTQEMMFDLLKKFVQPEITRGEIRSLWKMFYLRHGDALDFQEFLRHFIYNHSNAAFPNAKVFPPKKGDADLIMRSRKLNSDVNLLEDNLRSKIDFLWEQLRNEFVEMDPYGTGCISREEFQEIMKELAIQLTDFEINRLTEKFTQSHDGRVNYVELLKPFALRKQAWRGNHMMEILHHPQPELPVNPISSKQQMDLHSITKKLRQQLSGDWMSIRRAFKKLDNDKSGHLSLSEFRSVLQLCNVILDEEEVFQLMSQFDCHLSGKISYDKFLEQAKNQPETERNKKKVKKNK